jgi:hypothetical protein
MTEMNGVAENVGTPFIIVIASEARQSMRRMNCHGASSLAITLIQRFLQP